MNKRAGVDSHDIKLIGITVILMLFFLLIAAGIYSYATGASFYEALGGSVSRLFGGQSKEPLITLLLIFVIAALLVYVIENSLEVLTKMEFGGVRRMIKIGAMKEHYIICGYGRVGEHAAKRLAKEKKSFVVIDVEQKDFKGVPYIIGDSTKTNILKKAGILKAKGIVCALGKPEANVFLVITAKHLNPDIIAVARADDEDVAAKLMHAGADKVVMPEALGGIQLTEKILEFKNAETKGLPRENLEDSQRE